MVSVFQFVQTQRLPFTTLMKLPNHVYKTVPITTLKTTLLEDVYFWVVAVMDITLIIPKENVSSTVILRFSSTKTKKPCNVLLNVLSVSLVSIKTLLQSTAVLHVQMDGLLIIPHGLVSKHVHQLLLIMLISTLKLALTNVGKSWISLHTTLTGLVLLNVLLLILLIILLDVVLLTAYLSQALINSSMELKEFAYFNVQLNILPITVLENVFPTVQPVQIISLIGSQEHV